jgi:hypothetical protein
MNCSCNNHKHDSYKNHNHCSCDKHKHRSSDLKFYYSDDDTLSPVSKITFGSSVIQTSSGVLKNKTNTIGNFVQNKMCIVKTSTSAFVSNVETFYLSDGNIQFQPVGIQSLNSQGNYGLEANGSYKFKIINGTGKYLNSTGYVVIHTFPNLERLVKIYFTPLKK